MKYLFERRLLQMFLCPPWSIYKMVSGDLLKERKQAGIFLIAWTIAQWLLFITVGDNPVVSLISANVAVAMFYLLNLYAGLDLSAFSEGERRLIQSMLLKSLVTITVFFVMYAFPLMTSGIYADENSQAPAWGPAQRLLSAVLIISWFAFLLIDEYRTFDLFPKTAFKAVIDRLLPLTPRKLAGIYLGYGLLVILFLTLSRML